MVENIWFWQDIVSPHMAGLADAVAERGVDVTYVANIQMSQDRVSLGWMTPELDKCKLHIASDVDSVTELACSAPERSIHLCQGIWGNGLISHAQKELAKRGLRQWILMETVDDHDWKGGIKRMLYSYLFKRNLSHIEGVLATGHTTPNWVERRGVPAPRVYPFAYFLPEPRKEADCCHNDATPYHFLFVGQFIPLKRLDLLIQVMAEIDEYDFELRVVGSGPQEKSYRERAEKMLGERVAWVGRKNQEDVIEEMRSSDCLILPSRYDGWGAVVSESLMVGTPALVSDRCGSAGVVRASGQGKVFKADNRKDLREKLEELLKEGRTDLRSRQKLASWARCLGAQAGADYLIAIIESHGLGARRPSPPWLSSILCSRESILRAAQRPVTYTD